MLIHAQWWFRLIFTFGGAMGLVAGALFALQLPLVYAEASQTNAAPIIGRPLVWYNGALGTLPADQGLRYETADIGVITFPPEPSTAVQYFDGNGVRVDTTDDINDAAGFSDENLRAVIDRNSGFGIRFAAQVYTETRSGADRNGDNVDDRAGLSVIAISDDGQHGIEAGFWTDEVWVQEGGSGTSPDFQTHAEGVAIDVTALTVYELSALGNAYQLTVGDTAVLSGNLRDYTAFPDPPFNLPNPYKTANFIFFGDNTASAQADFKLTYIEVITNGELPDRTISATTDLVISDLRVIDVDAGLQEVVVTTTVKHGILTVSTTIPGGLTPTQVSGNGTEQVILNGSIGRLNNTLAFSGAVRYRSHANFAGADRLTITVNDQGNSGGVPQISSKQFQIVVSSSTNPVSQTLYLPLILR